MFQMIVVHVQGHWSAWPGDGGTIVPWTFGIYSTNCTVSHPGRL